MASPVRKADFSSQVNFYIKETSSKLVQTILKGETKNNKRSRGCVEDTDLEHFNSTKKLKRENETHVNETSISEARSDIILSGKEVFDCVRRWILDQGKSSVICLEKRDLQESKNYLEVTNKDQFLIKFGIEPIKLLVDEIGVASVFLVFKGLVAKKQLFQDGVFLEKEAIDIFQGILNDSYVICPGLRADAISCLSIIPFTPKKVKIFSYPIEHYAALDCLVWFKPPSNAPWAELKSGTYSCCNCSQASRYCKTFSTKKSKNLQGVLSTIAKSKRSPTSTHRLKYLSPQSIRVRNRKARGRRFRLIKTNEKLMKKCEGFKLLFNEKKSNQMIQITEIINRDYNAQVDRVISELPSETENDSLIQKTLKEVWMTDSCKQREKEKLDFKTDQNRNSDGSKSNRWSAITYRIAQAIACRSKAAYLALKQFDVLKLPSWRSVQSKMAHNFEEPGVNMDRLRRQKKCYDDYVNEQLAKGLKQPMGDGILIFDEVNVAPKVAWNSKNHKLIGLAMSTRDLVTLEDIYGQMSTEESLPKAGYMLQFLWRDLTSDYDIICPYYSSEGSTNSHFISACLFDVLGALHIVGFKVSAVLCDGASSNLSLMKLTQNYSGAYGVKINPESDEIDIEVKPWFKNPFLHDHEIFWIMCPSHEQGSHQLKNLINALFASKKDGSRFFKNNGTNFGWDAIVNMKKREDKRRDENIPRYVPKLLESYIIRDSWTKLNVKPAKIMQQDDVLSELFEHANPDDGNLPEDSKETMETHDYLKACNLLFENGMLSKSKVQSPSDPVMRNIEDGLYYFKQWLLDLRARDPKFNCMYTGKEFLSWQTWDLLRVMVFGFKGLVKYFTTKYPGYYLMPIRLNGSAVESLFSQYKFNANGKITSLNFAYSRKALLTKEDVHGHHHSGKGYRDTPLYVKQNFSKLL